MAGLGGWLVGFENVNFYLVKLKVSVENVNFYWVKLRVSFESINFDPVSQPKVPKKSKSWLQLCAPNHAFSRVL